MSLLGHSIEQVGAHPGVGRTFAVDGASVRVRLPSIVVDVAVGDAIHIVWWGG